ncbi:hypothetical protein GA0115233_111817 [Streptomyces sp. DI166]|uniref:hypothetical protein n=1 Tax=Streptomyces sp. DI166 TaxID=1839783 RepID=UPI0007F38D79|nr:hypothetical protein [Streptomyces sp. DI166]SBT95127.1 hypothetical protein GA0115233_111817 [Streptomyces sp. DI166]
MTAAARRAGARRAPLMLAAGLCLLAGLDAALVLLELPAPVTADRLPKVHGVLLVLGFAGTLVALERAVALGGRLPYAAPACLGAGGLLLLAPIDLAVPRLLLVAGCTALCLLYVRFWRRQPSAALLAQGAGAVCAVGAALLWLGGLDVPRLLPWLAAFLVLTIAGERLELARVGALAPSAEQSFLACVGAVVTGVVGTLMWPTTGTLILGLALLTLVAWLVAYDVARRLLRSTGLPRFTAACLLAGYAWLGLAGALWLLGGPVTDGTRYDAVVHAVFLGFVMSMIMAHAPVILPAVLRRPLPYHPSFAVAAWLLHLSLALRVLVGDLREVRGAWQVGGVLNIAAVLVFLLTAVTASVRATRKASSRTASARTASVREAPAPDAPETSSPTPLAEPDRSRTPR